MIRLRSPSPPDGERDLGAATDEVAESARSMWDTLLEALPRVGLAVGMVVGGWVASRGLRWVLRRWWDRKQSPSFAVVMSKLTGWLLLTVITMLAVAVTFPSVRPVDLLSGLGFFSLAIGFAFQDILENTLSGVLLLFRQPFRAGDQIEVVGLSGTVEAITIRETRITTFDGQLVIVPNRDVYKSAIRVITAYPARRVELTVGVAYDSDPEEVAAEIVDVVAAVDGVEPHPAPTAQVARLDPSVVQIRVWFWAHPRQADIAAVTHDVLTAIKRRLESAGIEMPAEILALQATTSLAAALRGEPVIGGGSAPSHAPGRLPDDG